MRKRSSRHAATPPRLYQNTLAFLAPDRARLQDLDEAVRRFLAWESILKDRALAAELSGGQITQAETQRANADTTVHARIPETYQWLLVPVQDTPKVAISWSAFRLTGQDALTVRASKKMRNDELLLTAFAPTRLKMELDRIPLWDGNGKSHVSVAEVADYFAKYLYLPRLKTPSLLVAAVQDGLKLLTWSQDSFAYADSYDDVKKRYRGLVCGRVASFGSDIPPGLLVKPEVAHDQLAAETPPPTSATQPTRQNQTTGHMERTREEGIAVDDDEATGLRTGLFETVVVREKPKTRPTRFHGSAPLAAARVGRDAGRIAEEVISHLEAILGAEVKVTIEIEAHLPDGASDEIVRIVTQNCRDLKFETQGFE